MIRYSVQCEQFYSSQSAAEAAAADLAAFFDKQDSIYEYPFTAFVDDAGRIAVTGWVRFATQAAQQSLVNRITSSWGSGPASGRALVGSRVLHHVCQNDPDVRSDAGCPANTVTVKA